MAAHTPLSSSTESTFLPSSPPPFPNALISINASHISIKLTSSNFPSWRGQSHALLIGHDLLHFFDGSYPCPSQSTIINGATVVNPEFTFWQRQDQLLLYALISSVSEPIVSFIATSSTFAHAWATLHALYTNNSRAYAMNIKHSLSTVHQESLPIAEYLQKTKALTDKLALIGYSVNADDLVIHTLNGIGPEYKDIAIVIHSRDTPITFLELQGKLLEFETALKAELNLQQLQSSLSAVHLT